MAICTLNTNLLRTSSCGYALPEIVDIYIVNRDSLSGDPTVQYGTGTSVGCDEITAVNLKEDGKSDKQRKCEEKLAKGGSIEILTEDEFYERLGIWNE